MRAGPRSIVSLGFICGLAACDSRYGLYITAHSDTERFDRIELHLGWKKGDSIPTGYNVRAPEGLQKLFVHDALDDVATSTEKTDSLTYYIPSGPNLESTRYALVIAYAGDQRVAIGEIVSLEVPGNEVFEYDVSLEPIGSANVVMWGPEEACSVWTRERNVGGFAGLSSVALVPEDDSACYASMHAADACELAPECANTNTCTVPCVTTKCGYGHCKVVSDGAGKRPVCAPEVCLDPFWCEVPATCSFGMQGVAGAAASSFVQCKMDLDQLARDFFIPYNDARYCVTMLNVVLAPGIACKNPRILKPEISYVAVTPNAGNPESCDVMLPATGLAPVDQEHLLLVVDTSGGPPTTFVVGIHKGTFSAGCADTSIGIPVPVGDHYDCAYQ
jgi:hypothetical protein